MMADFGIIIACCERDFCYTKGCVASIRQFMGDVPICLLIDGKFDTSALCKAYGLLTLTRPQVKSEFLRSNSFGYGLTKMVAFWESPFERFLFLDSDTIVWGDLRPKLALDDNWDLHIDRPRETFDERGVTKFFFDTGRLNTIYPDYRWQPHADEYFCTGVWAARRGVFSLDDYQAIFKTHRENADLFKCGEMGFLNFMIMRAMDSGAAKVRRTEMQTIVSDFPLATLTSRYGIDHPPEELPGQYEPTVLHYTHPKPFVWNGVWSGPMTRFRKAAAAKMALRDGPLLDFKLRREDFHFNWPYFRRRQADRAERAMKRLKSLVAGSSPS